MKVALLFNNFGPYHIARITAAYQLLHGQGLEVVGIEVTRASNQYAWKSEIACLPYPIHTVLSADNCDLTSGLGLLPSLNRCLLTLNPDILAISGYFYPSMLFALAWGRSFGKKVILFSESTEIDSIRFPWKERLKSRLVGQYNAALVGGQPQKRYMIKLGMPEEAIFFGYNVVGNEVFHPTQILRLAPPLARPYFLAINRFITKKNLPFLLNAYAAYRQIAGPAAWDLVLCGDGPLKLQLQQQVNTLGLSSTVHLPGFLQQADLLPYFAHASCFIHASTQEPWGLVVNEAMAARLPVLVSNRCGCFEDLVIEAVNGFGFDPENQPQLVNLMVKVSAGQIDLKTMGEASLAHIQNYSPAYFAQGLKQAIDYLGSQK